MTTMAFFVIFHSFLELHLQRRCAFCYLRGHVQFNKAVGNYRERPIGLSIVACEALITSAACVV
uniref:Secreted protein n=1 Tax=Setaria viridis TaxID=4556 RepID=A0A4U6UTV9_SETVI|nr:hypothetical protein SEVIR_4G054801v2 [Setaria viridis]